VTTERGGRAGKNYLLIAARERCSLSGGEPMLPPDVAEEMNAFLWAEYQVELKKGRKARKPTTLDHRFVLAYEAGRHRWPSAQYRAAFRHVLRVATDAELGFSPSRRRRNPGSTTPARAGTVFSRPMTANEVDVHQRRAHREADHYRLSGPLIRLADGPGFGETGGSTEDAPSVKADYSAVLGGGSADSAAEADLVEFTSVLDQRGISNTELTAVELACERLDQDFARTPPDEVLTKIRLLMKRVSHHLRQSQTLSHHERLVRLAARLAGLRAWACFDIDGHREADWWYEAAVSAAQESKAWGLGAWLLGAQSLIPWHRRDLGRAAELIERGIYFAGQGSDATTRAWLYALQARGQAGRGDMSGFDTSYAAAQGAVEHSSERDRRHGMDFAEGTLDLRYYCGTSRLLLQQPQQARAELTGSLNALPKAHTKARAVLSLFIADAVVQSGAITQARDLALHALASTVHQPILPILQQGRRIRRLVHQKDPAAAATLDDAVREFSTALTAAASKARS
jgi:hypothetical protein